MTLVPAKRVTCPSRVPLQVTHEELPRNGHETIASIILDHLPITNSYVFALCLQRDAITCLAPRNDNGQTGPSVTKPRSHDEIRIPKTIGSEKMARERVELFAVSMGWSPERIEDIKTAVGEAFLNAIEHASPDDPADTVLVQCDSEGGEIQVAVSSKGAPFVASGVKPDILAKIEGRDRPRGWGLFLIRSFADKFELSTENEITTVRMKFLLKNTR